MRNVCRNLVTTSAGKRHFINKRTILGPVLKQYVVMVCKEGTSEKLE
jgi:hypothetical protein